MATYEGKRLEPARVVVTVDGEPLNMRFDLRNHSPNGPEWGYGGSGPAQLALAILAYLLEDDERVHALHQPFKWDVIAKLPAEGWTLTDTDIASWFMRLEADDLEGMVACIESAPPDEIRPRE